VPANVQIHEFYLQSGAWMRKPAMQRGYASINYTHVSQVVSEAGVNLLLQLVAERPGEHAPRYSLSCNPDVTFDAIELSKKRPLVVGVVHPDLPFMPHDAEVGEGFFDGVVSGESCAHQLFALPREPVNAAEFALGMHASSLIRDGGTLQIGIGALSDALVHACLLRHRDNVAYQRVLDALQPSDQQQRVVEGWGGCGPFELGLYGASEMIMDGFMHLVEGGVLRRQVFAHLGVERLRAAGQLGDQADAQTLERLLEVGGLELPLHVAELNRLKRLGLVDPECHLDHGYLVFEDGVRVDAELTSPAERRVLARHMAGRALRGGLYLQGAFFLGSKLLYEWLRELPEDQRAGIGMTRVTHINDLPTGSTALAVSQRRHARFFNTCMMQTLLGAAVSDALDNGQVVSGVGGQYNFVAMAHRLADGRSVIMLRAVRESAGGASSNIVWNYGHTTIPRHLRDLVVTEYGVADLKGRSDEECIQALLQISDSRFQDELLAQARAAGKIDPQWEIPAQARRNTPERLVAALDLGDGIERFPRFPFGSDLDPTELRLAKALRSLKEKSSTLGGKLSLLGPLLRGGAGGEVDAALARMGLAQPADLKQRMIARLIAGALDP
ncbi:MAG: acetyl-CoA hydrolase, partial [Xanthomonadales bacterium]|nr:acetyl-CoA hydrolase [Xanthomonadales bacterium]